MWLKRFYLISLFLFASYFFVSCVNDDAQIINKTPIQEDNPDQESTAAQILITGQNERPSNIEGLNADYPAYIKSVSPSPKQELSLTIYQEASDHPDFWGAKHPGICVSYAPLHIWEEGEFPTQEEVIDWISLDVGPLKELKADIFLTHDSSEIIMHPADEQGNVDYEGEPIAILPWGSPYWVCYDVPLGPGHHVIKAVAKKGDKFVGEYRWSFQIVE